MSAACVTTAGAQDATDPVDPSIDLYVTKCASCHTVGKGDRVGPDLSGVHQRRDRAWLERFIAEPSKMLGTDADARKLLADYNGVRMPDLGLSRDQVTTLIDLVARCSSEECVLVGKFTPVTEAGPAEATLGKQLFTGELALAAGGPPCFSCHSVADLGLIQGGTLSKDLTHVFARLGDEGLDAALKNPTFNLMNKIYGEKPIDKGEVFALRAYLNQANRESGDATGGLSLPLVGILAAILALAALNALWRERLLSVRQSVTARKGRTA